MHITRNQLRKIILEALAVGYQPPESEIVSNVRKLTKNYPLVISALIKIANHPNEKIKRLVNTSEIDLTEEVNWAQNENHAPAWYDLIDSIIPLENYLMSLGQVFMMGVTGAIGDDGSWEFEPFLTDEESDSFDYFRDLENTDIDFLDPSFVTGMDAAYHLKNRNVTISPVNNDDQLFSYVKMYDDYVNSPESTSFPTRGGKRIMQNRVDEIGDEEQAMYGFNWEFFGGFE